MTDSVDKDTSTTPDLNVENGTSVATGASRRAGNLWTTEARDDMFNRRERGEGWESICQDYPSRSRHAMQQQYSMMKKQKMMAEGTWTNNRRGRKRKALGPGPISIIRKQSGGLEAAYATEDDFASVTPSDPEIDDLDDMVIDEADVDTPGTDFGVQVQGPSQSILDFRPGRPSGLSRSATDPAPRGRGRGRGRVPSGFAPSDVAPQPLAPKSFTPVNETTINAKSAKRALNEHITSPQAKRQKGPNDTAEDGEEPGDPAPRLPFSEPAVYFTQAELLTFFRSGVRNADLAKEMLEEERSNRHKVFHEAQGRANRRAFEAEEKIKDMGYRHRSDIRQFEHNHGEKFDALRSEYEGRIQRLEKELAIARGGVLLKADAKQSAGPTMALSHPSADNVAAGSLQSMEPAANGTAPSLTTANNATAQQSTSDQPGLEWQIMKLAENLEELKGRFETERERARKAEAQVAVLSQRNGPTSDRVTDTSITADVNQVISMISKLNSEVDELAPKIVAKNLAEISEKCAAVASQLAKPQDEAAKTSYISAHVQSAGPVPVVPTLDTRMGNTEAPAPDRPKTMPVSATPSPAPGDKTQATIAAHVPGLPTPSDAPFENMPFEHKANSGAFSINQLIHPNLGASMHSPTPLESESAAISSGTNQGYEVMRPAAPAVEKEEQHYRASESLGTIGQGGGQ